MNIFNSDIQAVALFMQAIATVFIGILAWTAARSQNILSEKRSRKELYKRRYANIYQEAINLFGQSLELIQRYQSASKIKNVKKKQEENDCIMDDFYKLKNKFITKIESEQYLIKLRDYDKLKDFCNKYIALLEDYVSGRQDNEICPNFYVIEHYNRHEEILRKILSNYFYHENESKISLYTYKAFKYLKNHWLLFLEDYFPTYIEVLKTMFFVLIIIFGILITIVEVIKEVLKAEIIIKEKKIHLNLKMKTKFLKRNRPWPL